LPVITYIAVHCWCTDGHNMAFRKRCTAGR